MNTDKDNTNGQTLEDVARLLSRQIYPLDNGRVVATALTWERAPAVIAYEQLKATLRIAEALERLNANLEQRAKDGMPF